jgi:CBS-domain-containing membrane protein
MRSAARSRLRARCAQLPGGCGDPALQSVRWASLDDSAPRLAECQARLSEEQLASEIDLAPWLNAAPHCVQAGAPLSQLHPLFREMGLRHLLVLPRPPAQGVLGVLTRKDLLPAVVRARMSELPLSVVAT